MKVRHINRAHLRALALLHARVRQADGQESTEEAPLGGGLGQARILDSRGVVLSDPIEVLAHLQLARALSLSGEKAKSQNAYEEFFDRWKEAEPGIPILRSARAESAALK